MFSKYTIKLSSQIKFRGFVTFPRTGKLASIESGAGRAFTFTVFSTSGNAHSFLSVALVLEYSVDLPFVFFQESSPMLLS